MQALKVTFKFAAPVLRDSEYPIHLDALVARAVMLELEEFGAENAWAESSDLSAIFERSQGHADQWVWKSSMLMFRPALPKQWVNQVRRCEPESYYRDLGVYWVGQGKQNELGIRPETFSIDTGSGHLRGYQWLAATQWMDSAEAWAVADRDALQHYLGKISYIGKKGVNGYGRISGFTIEEANPTDAENWSLRILAKGIEGKPGVQYEPVMACLHAPYWKKTQRVMAFEPIV